MTTQYTTKNFNCYRLADKMTASGWDRFFRLMKAQVKPCGMRYMAVPHAARDDYENDEYIGETAACRYKNFINSILKSVRNGNVDYCFYVFQVRDLLKYEPRITVRYLENHDCFCVSIEE